MEAIPKQIRARLEAMSLADLDIMATVLGKETNRNEYMRTRVEWISVIMTEKILIIFDTNEDETMIGE